jgi:hypothetical protein
MSYQQPAYQAPAPPIDREVHGVLIGVEARTNGWMRFSIKAPDQQYPYKADTKKPEVIQAAMSMMHQPVSAQVREQDSQEINPHNGQPYKNRYLNAIAPQGYAPGVMPSPQRMANSQPPGPTYPQQPVTPAGPQPPAAPGPQPAMVQPGISGYEKDINIMRQTASKVVAMSLETLPPEQRTPAGMVAACEAWLAYYVYGPLRFGVQPFSSPSGQGGDFQPRTSDMPFTPDAAEEARATGAAYGYDWDGTGPCPDCGFTGQHAIGCPRGDYA